MSISLSSGVRQALFSLQSTTAQAEAQQIKLATGRKVNSALDNPAAFFTASSLNARAGDFSSLLDDMGQAVKTLETADVGIKTITKLVETARGIARSARALAEGDREALATQYNELLKQIDGIAQDSTYNGVNLLNDNAATNKLTVVFNEKTTTPAATTTFAAGEKTSIDIAGADVTVAELGLTAAAAPATWTDAQVDAELEALTDAVSSLRTTSSTFGANLTVVKSRQEFSKQLINTLITGADNLVLADANEEGAKLVTLQTRQQLSSTALSLANQSDQAVLRLFN
jgi:flagellin